MLYREIEEKIKDFFQTEKKSALMITGARQVGKTYCIREFAKENFPYVIEINFLEMPSAVTLFENASDSRDILLRISALTDVPMEKGKTLIFFDEVQECKEIVTAIKFLVEEGSFRYILSGSLLGVELKDIRSIPVGYMSIYEMFPMNFFEFCPFFLSIFNVFVRFFHNNKKTAHRRAMRQCTVLYNLIQNRSLLIRFQVFLSCSLPEYLFQCKV